MGGCAVPASGAAPSPASAPASPAPNSGPVDGLAPEPARPDTLVAAFQATVASHPDRVALHSVQTGLAVTWQQYATQVRAVAAGLARLGVGRGDTVGLMLSNRPEFAILDTAAMHLGAVPFSLYNTSSPEQIAHVLANAGNRVLICEQSFLANVRSAASHAPDLEHLVCLEGAVAPGVRAFAELTERSDESWALTEFDPSWRGVGPDDVATIIYTSGTTGPPKGVELTHANLLAEVRASADRLPLSAADRTISYLPSAHIADRWLTHYAQLVHGHQTSFVADPREISAGLQEVRPTVWGAVPRVWQKLRTGLEAAGVPDPATLSPGQATSIRSAVGLDQLRWAVSGAAPVAPELLEYFSALGVRISEVWGMSETSCCVSANPLEAIRIGTVGTVLPGIEVRVADDGELLVRGDVVMRGYRSEPTKTAEAVIDGWLHTGDVGSIDADGYVRLLDRKKELIINAAGKNMSPANIEQTLQAASPLIGQAVCIGDGRPYNVALVVLDRDHVAEADIHSPELAQKIESARVAANARLSRVEQIKRVHIVEADWPAGGDELTPTLKLKRREISRKYAREIEALYR